MSLRVFHRAAMIQGDIVVLDEAESHYLTRVRRAQPGDPVDVLDGTAAAFAGTVVDARREAATVQVGAALPHPTIAPIDVAIGMPDPKAALDAIATACALGAERVSLVRCEHSHTAPPGAARIARVIEATQRQCGRPGPMPVDAEPDLDKWLARPGDGYVAWTKLRGQPTAIDPVGPGPARVLIGPEGGLTDDEVTRARGRGFRPLGLGPWTLRTELAVAAALTRLLCR